MRGLDWFDILLHIIVACMVIVVVRDLGIWGAVIANGFLWPFREWEQRRLKGKNPWRFSRQNHWEAWPPVLAGFAVAALS